MTINLNSQPYFDDFDQEKGFHRILFRPGHFAVQARELTQLQTILQNQIKNQGDFVLENGSPVVGGLASYTNELYYIRLTSLGTGISATDFIGNQIDGQTSNAKAVVVHATASEINDQYSTVTDPATLYVRMTSDEPFTYGETILDSLGHSAVISTETIQGNGTGYNAIGRSSLAFTDEGIYYVDGFFVWSPKQTITLNKYNSIPSYRVGHTITQEIVTEDDDESLLDPAIGVPNSSAPGAHRLKVSLTLSKKSVKGNLGTVNDSNGDPVTVEYGTSETETLVEQSASPDFIELLRVVDGYVQNKVKHPELGELEHTLARRTYDESGNYTVRPWQLKMIDHVGSDETKLSASLERGKGYIKGYEFETDATRYLDFNKGRDTDSISGGRIGGDYGNWVYVTSYTGKFDTTSFQTVDLHTRITSNVLVSSKTNYECYKIGTARVRYVEYISGTPGVDAIYKVYLFNILVQDGYSFKDVKSIQVGYDTTGTWVAGTSDILGKADVYDDSLYGAIVRADDSALKFSVDADTGTITAFEADGVTEKSIFNSEGFAIGGYATIHGDTPGNLNIGQGGGSNKSPKRQILNVSGSRLVLDTTDFSMEDKTAQGEDFIIMSVDARLGNRDMNNLLFPIAEGTIKETSDQDYERQQQAVVTASSGSVSVTCGADERFLSAPDGQKNSRYGILVHSTGEWLDLSSATFTPAIGGSTTMQIDDVSIPAGLVTIVYSINHVNTGAEPRAKTLNRNQTISIDETLVNRTPEGKNYLGVSDIYKLKAVYDLSDKTTGSPKEVPYLLLVANPGNEKWGINGGQYIGERVVSSTGATGTTVDWNDSTKTLKIIPNSTFQNGDTVRGLESGAIGVVLSNNLSTCASNISDRFELDSGQRDNYYDHGSIKLKKGQKPPEGDQDLIVIVDYFTSTGSGYFSVDSYPTIKENYDETGGALSEANKPIVFGYGEIPKYTSTNGGETFFLQDYFDYRPCRDNDALTVGTTTASINADDGIEEAQLDSGNDLKIPSPFSAIEADYTYYLNRIDKIVATKDKSFKIIEGISAINPVRPPEDKDAMTLYVVEVPAYTFNASDCKITYVENKRYTMRDIGRLEKRIENLEYYTSLNLLEKQATEQNITTDDPTTGEKVERFKNGIIVDSFNGHSIGDVSDRGYRCSIDFDRGELRPAFNPNCADLDFDSTSSTSVTKTGDLITLPYVSAEFINQPLKSETTSVNPFDIARYIGIIKLSPDTDTFYDKTIRPDVIMNTEGDNDAYVAMGKEEDDDRLPGFGSKFNEEQKNWRGVDTAKDNSSFSKDNVKSSNANTSKKNIYRSDVNRNTTSVTKKRTQKGVNSEGIEKIEKSVGNRIVDVNIVPYVRTKSVSFVAHGMKPNTRVYAFFDNTDINDYVTWGSDGYYTDEHGSISGAFIIPSGTFRAGERVFRLTDSSSNTITTTTTLAEGTYYAVGLLNNAEDKIVATRPPIIKKESIQQIDVVSDAISRSRIDGTVSGTTTIDGIEVPIRSGRTEVQTLLVSSDGTGIPTEQTVDVKSGTPTLKNPLSQTFIVDDSIYPSGIFVSSIDISFYKKDEALPVSVQIRPVSNGYAHATKILPFAEKTLLPDDISVSDDGATYTRFTFDSPVYLSANGVSEYAIVVDSDSKNYEVFTATLGNNELGSVRKITKQPYIGSFYRSQNTGLWQPDPLTSLCFKLNRCKFTVSSSGTAIFKNPERVVGRSVTKIEITDPGEGYDDGDVYSNDSTLDSSGTARITITYGNPPTASTYPKVRAIVNESGQFDSVEIVDGGSDFSFAPIITIDPPASGTTATAEVVEIDNDNLYMNSMIVVSEELGFSETKLYHEIKTTPSVGSGASNGKLNSINTASTDFADVFVDQKQYYSTQQKITPASGSVILRSTLVSGDDSVSPVIDDGRLAVLTIENLINSLDGIGGGNNDLSSELLPKGGDAKARYITRRVTLEEGFESNGIKVYLTACKQNGTEIYVYVKPLSTESEEPMDDLPWIQLYQEQISTLIAENSEDYREYSYGTLNPFDITEGTSELDEFKSFAVKIVMVSDDDCVVPKISDIRAMALAPIPVI